MYHEIFYIYGMRNGLVEEEYLLKRVLVNSATDSKLNKWLKSYSNAKLENMGWSKNKIKMRYQSQAYDTESDDDDDNIEQRSEFGGKLSQLDKIIHIQKNNNGDNGDKNADFGLKQADDTDRVFKQYFAALQLINDELQNIKFTILIMMFIVYPV